MGKTNYNVRGLVFLAGAIVMHVVVIMGPLWLYGVIDEENLEKWRTNYAEERWFPGGKDYLPTTDAAPYGEFMVAIMLLLAISESCDMIFVNALNFLVDDFEEGMKGSLFLAIGSSAPELFTSVSGLVVTIFATQQRCSDEYPGDDDAALQCEIDATQGDSGASVGMSTIAGSAIVNILIVIGARCSGYMTIHLH